MRDGELMGAKWDEIDRKENIWTVPAKRMKAGREHRVPLVPRALEILDAVEKVRTGPWIFPGMRGDAPLSEMGLEMVMRKMKVKPYTVHGFRSSFSTWRRDATRFERELGEAALAHTIADKVEAAYQRGDALERRRAMMQAWAVHCAGTAAGNVLPFKAVSE